MKEITQYVRDWFARAEDDIVVMNLILEKGTGSPNLACFHAEQAVEKCLKGFLAHHGKHVRKSHDLPDLIEECVKVDPSFSELAEDARYLTQFYIESRYPDDYVEFPRDDAERAAEAAIRIKEFVWKRITGASHDQQGFSVFAVVASFVVLAVLAGIAYLFFATNNSGLSNKESVERPQSRNRDTAQEITGASSTSEKIDTSTWKTYRNEEYGFEMKYPDDLFITTQDSIGIPLVLSLKGGLAEPAMSVTVNMLQETPGYPDRWRTLEEYANFVKKIQLKDVQIKAGEVLIDQDKWIELRTTRQDGGISDWFVFIRNELLFSVLIGLPNSDALDAEFLLKQILSTFKFTK